MKSSIIGAASLAFAAVSTKDLAADAFFLSPGGLTASSTSLLGTTPSARTSLSGAAHGAACTCSNCIPGLHGVSCMCPSCSSASISARSHGARCRCGACSVRMQAHGEGCGCGDCSPPPSGALHGATCKCSACVSASHTESCSCAICAGGRRRTSVTVLGMGAAGTSEGEVVSSLRERLLAEPEAVIFEDTMATVGQAFDYSPKRFVNGATSSEAGMNEGSCKVFSFGKLASLSPEETLACFGEHYRSVVADPAGDSHGNIRAFMKTGWEGVLFPDGIALTWK